VADLTSLIQIVVAAAVSLNKCVLLEWLTLAACVVMWGPCLTELLLSKWELGTHNQEHELFSNTFSRTVA